MGYVATPAFMTKSTSRHGGDGRWPPVKRLVIRNANLVAPSNLPGAYLGSDLGDEFSWTAQIPNMIEALKVVTGTALQVRQSEMDAKAARNKAAADKAAADQLMAANKAAADQAAAQIQAQNAAPTKAGGVIGDNSKVWLVAGGSAAGLLVLYLLLRK